MQTEVTSLPERAAQFIRQGGIVAFPTETVYGLGANVFDAAAIAKVFAAKRRPADNPLIVHVAATGQIGELTTGVTENAQRFIDRFFPGPLTVVLRKRPEVPDVVTAGLDTIGVRMPRGAAAHQFLLACGVPVAAPSANISGRPSPTTWLSVIEDLDGRIDCVLQGDATEIGLESTVVDCTVEPPRMLRSGSVTIEQLREVVPTTCITEAHDVEPVRSPGMKHRHYSPRARVVIADRGSQFPEISNSKTAFIGLGEVEGQFAAKRICDSVDEYASALFEFFRDCDRSGIEMIYCEAVDEAGIGAALMDRLRRAAEA